MKSYLYRFGLIPMALLLGSAWGAAAQTSGSGNASVAIGTVLYISVTNTSVSFPTVTEADYNTGYVVGSANSTVTSKGNAIHTLKIQANAATMTATGTGARADKPASDLQVRTRPASGTWGSAFGLSTTAQNLVASRAAGDHSSSLYEVEYRVLLNWANDTPGTYTLGFTYTIVAG